MTTAIRTELLKLRTTRLAIGMLAVAAAWTGLVAAIEASRAGPGGMVPSLATTAGLRDVLTSTGFALIIAAAYGTTVTSGELRHHTITDTYLDEPNRRQVLMAKVIAAGLTGLIFGVVGTIVTTGIGLAFAGANGDHIAIAGGTIARYGAGAVIGAGLLAAAGAAIGTLIANQVGAIIAVFAWGFGVEQIVGGVFHSVTPYLPLMASETMAGSTSGGMPPLPKGFTPLPFAGVIGLVTVIALILAAIASTTTINRDIT
jgi:ABC-2 type transport system permease protein